MEKQQAVSEDRRNKWKMDERFNNEQFFQLLSLETSRLSDVIIKLEFKGGDTNSSC